ncbi:hypothetical protein, partial [Leptospira saintgironsiae]
FLTESFNVGRVREGSVVQLYVDTDGVGGANHYITARVVKKSNGTFDLAIFDHTDSKIKDISIRDYYREYRKAIHRIML